ncbi:hypothetical protein SDC9_145841 [bioreactor metagenome]|uniref:Uncharacterized protein n=1 Tax=bioreactor metagenome TaxID=1076179 RepID=A0A645ED35_9ZZZZ
MLAGGIERKLRVKRNHVIDFFQRNAKPFCNSGLHFDRQITVEFLRLLQHRHQGSLHVLVVRNDFVELFFLLLRSAKRNNSFLLSHILPPRCDSKTGLITDVSQNEL